MKAVHFGAGNIGRGFIGQILNKNDFEITFVDLNQEIVTALNQRKKYEIGYAAPGGERYTVNGVKAINNGEHPEKVVQAIEEADIITTAIGPNILPYIAELIAKGIQLRYLNQKDKALDIIACENMIGGSEYLHKEVSRYLSEEEKQYVESYIGFPNAAVDRIVPMQSNEDILYVSVEPFKEWVIDTSQVKAKNIYLEGVMYVDDLEPYIERKLFSVNTGHATVAYSGAAKGYQTIREALEDVEIVNTLNDVLKETGALLIDKWGFDENQHAAYREKVIRRFQNPYISDDISRVGRTPIRKLGYDERFIRPIRECKERGLSYCSLLKIVGKIFKYDDNRDEQSVQLQNMIKNEPLEAVIHKITNISDPQFLAEIAKVVQ